MQEEPLERIYSVLVIDMAHAHDEDGERTIQGFASLEAARAYAEARMRASVEELRGKDKTPAEIRSLWHLYGEDCIVVGDSYRGSEVLDLYIEVPATPAETDWVSLTPLVKRFRVMLLFSESGGTSAWAGGWIRRYLRPNKAVLSAIFLDDALAAFARKGLTDVTVTDVHQAHLFELFDPPTPPHGRPLKRWKVHVDFVCHDVKFGSDASGVFLWPEEPAGSALNLMQRLLVGDMMAWRGDGPDIVGYCDLISCTVAETEEAADYPLDQEETPIPPRPAPPAS